MAVDRSDTGPFAIVPLWLLDALSARRPKAFATAIAVYVALAQWADYSTLDGYPSHASIGASCRLGTTAVRDAMSLLCEVGAIETWERFPYENDPKRQGSNGFRLLRALPPTSRRTHPLAQTHPPPSPRRHLTRPIKQEPILLSDESETDGATQTRFAEFYLAYPRKKARIAAEKAYERALKHADHATLMAGLARAAAGWRAEGKDARYIPYPASWLNAGGWADDTEPAHGKPVGPRWVCDPECSDCGGDGLVATEEGGNTFTDCHCKKQVDDHPTDGA